MRIKTLSRRALVLSALGITLLAGTVYAAVTVILAVGTIPESELFGGGPATVTVRTLTINPGESLAWHYHPGYAFNVVKSGVLTVEEGCGGEQNLGVGEAFEEVQGHVHRAKNLTTEPVLVYNTFIMPQGQPTTVNIPNNERKCGPPSTVDDCLVDGWMNFTHPQPFENQGQCVKWVLQRPTTTIAAPY